MKRLFYFICVIFFASCSYNRVIILDNVTVESKKVSRFRIKSDTIKMITLETGEVITHDELDRRFEIAIKKFKEEYYK
jgi:hypothetical protein